MGGLSSLVPPVSEEAAVTITVNDRELVTLLCTPRDLRELAVGWLFGEGHIESAGDILSLGGCAHDRELLVSLAREPQLGAGHWRLITSGCGAGASAGLLQLDKVPRVVDDTRFSLVTLRKTTVEMLRGAPLYRRTGGVHSAALARAGEILVCREDIGRHNAVDKVIGSALLAGLDVAGMALLSTGRLSSEMVWKAARAGVPLVASLSIPSDLACTIADAAGITVVGRVLAAKPGLYTYAERIEPD